MRPVRRQHLGRQHDRRRVHHFREVFETLPTGERQYWHPHNGEILSGQLVAPGLPGVAEKELMKGKMNSYDKTWHTWAAAKGEKVPMGTPMLAWSFNRDGEGEPGLVAKRDKTLGIITADVRQSRQDMVSLAKPQEGVDSLKGKFGRPTTDIPGVTAKLPRRDGPSSARPVTPVG